MLEYQKRYGEVVKKYQISQVINSQKYLAFSLLISKDELNSIILVEKEGNNFKYHTVESSKTFKSKIGDIKNLI